MENIFFECESSFEGAMYNTNLSLESAIFTYSENLLTNHYVTEAVKDSLWTKLKQFFTRIVLSIKNFIKEVKMKIEYLVNENKIRYKLDNLRKELKEKQSEGIRKIQLVDYESMERVYNKYYNELSSYAKRFSKVKYTKTWQIEDDLKDFDNLIEKFNNELNELSQKKVEWAITKALDFVEDEIRGKTEVLNSINNFTRDIAEIEQLAENLKTRMNILGADVIPKHVGFIQKMINAISGFVRKWTIKIIMGIAFIFTI